MLGSTASTTAVGIILSTQFVLVDGASTPTREAFGWVFFMGATVVAAGAVIALFIPRHSPHYQTSSIPVQSP
jgi:hypothetical protein